MFILLVKMFSLTNLALGRMLFYLQPFVEVEFFHELYKIACHHCAIYCYEVLDD